MSYQCNVKEQSCQPTLAIRTRTSVEDLSQVLGQAYGSVAQYVGEQGGQFAGPPYVAYYNDDMEDLDIEIGFPVARELPGRGEIQAGEIPGGRAAICIHVGPYGKIDRAYEALSQWMEESDLKPTGVAYEFYLNDPEETPPEQLMTQIVFPLKE